MVSILHLGCILESPRFQKIYICIPTRFLLQTNETRISGDGAEALGELKSSPGDAKVQPGLRATEGLDLRRVPYSLSPRRQERQK